MLSVDYPEKAGLAFTGSKTVPGWATALRTLTLGASGSGLKTALGCGMVAGLNTALGSTGAVEHTAERPSKTVESRFWRRIVTGSDEVFR